MGGWWGGISRMLLRRLGSKQQVRPRIVVLRSTLERMKMKNPVRIFLSCSAEVNARGVENEYWPVITSVVTVQCTRGRVKASKSNSEYDIDPQM